MFRHPVADAETRTAIGEALLEAGGAGDSEVAEASHAPRRAVAELLQGAQQAGAVRDDVELPEVYVPLVGASRAAPTRLWTSGHVPARSPSCARGGRRPRAGHRQRTSRDRVPPRANRGQAAGRHPSAGPSFVAMSVRICT
ncbi:SbtR family transcriptional regulator [Streptomyces sp. NPDC001135]